MVEYPTGNGRQVREWRVGIYNVICDTMYE